MNTYSQLIYHMVFATRNRERTLSKPNRDELFKYISGIIRNKKCHLYRINGVADHIHIATHVNMNIKIPDLVKDIKLASNAYIKENRLFPLFSGWQGSFAAFTCSFNQKDKLIEYIINQEKHHGEITFEDEYRSLMEENGVEFDERYLL